MMRWPERELARKRSEELLAEVRAAEVLHKNEADRKWLKAMIWIVPALPIIRLGFEIQVDGVPVILLPVIAFFVLGIPLSLIGAWHGRDGYLDDGRDSWHDAR